MDLQDKPLKKNKNESEKIMDDFHYSYKFRYTLITTILFFILSQKVSYKILDLLFQTFSYNIVIMEEDNYPSIIAILIMAIILGLIVFII